MYKSIDKWLPGYVRSVFRRPGRVHGTRHLLFCIADHFEPFWNGVGRETAVRRVGRWVGKYPRAVAAFRDADGRTPRHTFFYPQEQYDQGCLEPLAFACGLGAGEVEIHLHHRNDTADGLRDKLLSFRDTLRSRHGLLGNWKLPTPASSIAYGFVHGNWALCNSLPGGDWCGVDEELAVLRDTGCYADFTFPSAPSPTQPKMVNCLYYASDTPGRPRGHDKGIPMEGGGRGAESLLLITGPLGLDWRRRKLGFLPGIDNGTISSNNPPSPGRTDLWVRQHIHVAGRPEWVFVKVHSHGCVEANEAIVLGNSMRKAHEHLTARYNDGSLWRLHYVTAREMYNIARAAEDGLDGNPCDYLDYEIGPPPAALSS